jgi:Protein of unknown function (DUF3159)
VTGRHAHSKPKPVEPRPSSVDTSVALGVAEEDDRLRPTILEQLGGIPGMIYSTVPVVLFVVVNSFTSLSTALIAAVGVAVAIAVWRLIRKEPLQPAVSGLFAVGIGALIAHHTGQARDFFLLGIWYSGVLAVLFLLSVLMGWPLAGVIWHGINGDGQAWRSDRALRRAYMLATLLWAVMFAVKFVAQRWLYDANQPGWLAFARVAGYALTGLALLGTLWAVRRARGRSTEVQPA